MASLLKNLAPEYVDDENQKYASGDIVIQNEKIIICEKDTSGPFDETCWRETSLSELFRGLGNSNLGGIEKITKEDITVSHAYTVPKGINFVSVGYGGTANALLFNENLITLSVGQTTDKILLVTKGSETHYYIKVVEGDTLRMSTGSGTVFIFSSNK